VVGLKGDRSSRFGGGYDPGRLGKNNFVVDDPTVSSRIGSISSRISGNLRRIRSANWGRFGHPSFPPAAIPHLLACPHRPPRHRAATDKPADLNRIARLAELDHNADTAIGRTKFPVGIAICDSAVLIDPSVRSLCAGRIGGYSPCRPTLRTVSPDSPHDTKLLNAAT
jgi:hypothetical protein